MCLLQHMRGMNHYTVVYIIIWIAFFFLFIYCECYTAYSEYDLVVTCANIPVTKVSLALFPEKCLNHHLNLKDEHMKLS